MKKKINTTAVFIACYISYCAIYIARLNLSVASPALTAEGVFSLSQIGLLGGLFSAVYATGRLLSGVIGDRVKPWVLIVLGLGTAGISNIFFGMLPPFWASVVLWCANAFAQSMLWGVILRLVSAVYSKELAGKKASQMVTSVTAGNLLGVICNSFFISRFGTAYAFIIPGGLTLLCGLLIMFTAKNIECPAAGGTSLKPMFLLLKRKEVRGVIYPAFLHGIIKDNISLWMTAFFVFQFGINLESSTYFVLFIPAVGFMGRILYPVFYMWSKDQEHKVSIAALCLCALAVVLLLSFPRQPVIAMTCLGVIYAAVSVVNTSILTITPLRYSKNNQIASVSGIMDFATYLGASAGSFVYGYVIDLWGYTPMFVSWLGVSVLAVLLLKCLPKEE